MAENNLDKALAFLGTSLQSLVQQANGPVDLDHLHTRIAKRSLSGDQITGGTITSFASSGIKDEATKQQIIVKDSGVELGVISVGQVKGNLAVENSITAKSITVDVVEVKELKTDLKLGQSAALEITVSGGDTLVGKGMLLKGQGTTKQLIFTANPDKFTSTESFELTKDREFRINGDPVLSATALGQGVVKSNLRELGRLRGLVVDGSASFGQYVFYNDNTNRLGVGIEEPNAGLSVCEDGVEVMLGTKDQSIGIVGTYASVPFEIVTDSTARITVGSSGNITFNSSEIVLNGKMAIGVRTRDPRVDLHVAGAVKYQDHIHQYLNGIPDSGTYTKGDIIWNTEPDVGRCVGWVCVRAGSPGTWMPFGEIKQSG
jgi:hypothetical protein